MFTHRISAKIALRWPRKWFVIIAGAVSKVESAVGPSRVRGRGGKGRRHDRGLKGDGVVASRVGTGFGLTHATKTNIMKLFMICSYETITELEISKNRVQFVQNRTVLGFAQSKYISMFLSV
jgi:hypothetical protein